MKDIDDFIEKLLGSYRHVHVATPGSLSMYITPIFYSKLDSVDEFDQNEIDIILNGLSRLLWRIRNKKGSYDLFKILDSKEKMIDIRFRRLLKSRFTDENFWILLQYLSNEVPNFDKKKLLEDAFSFHYDRDGIIRRLAYKFY